MTDRVRILVVDDEPAAQRLLARILDKKGYLATITGDVSSAMQLLELEDFALVMTDLDMPGASGLELIEALGARRPSVASILVTGRGGIDVASAAVTSGAYGYMNKPFLPDEVEITVLNALRRRELELESQQHREQLEAMVRERTSELMESLAELQVAQEELQKRSEQLLELERMKAQFIQVVSHELRTPLTVIRGGIQTVRRAADSIDPALRDSLLASAQVNADALGRMINKILAATSIRRGVVGAEHDRFSLEELAREASRVGDAAAQRRLVMRLMPAAAYGHRELLIETVRDLVDNALLYTEGRVTLATWEAADEAVLTVSDEGPGIDARLLERLLEEPFIQGDSSTTRTTGGLGLSLYLAKRVTEASSGRFEIDSSGSGTKVSLVLRTPQGGALGGGP